MKLGKIKSIGKAAMPTVGRVAGVLAGNYLPKVIPVGSDKVKYGLVTAVGMFLAVSQKGIVQNVGEGLAVGGGLNLLKTFGIGGDDYMVSGIEDARFVSGLKDLASGGNLLNGGDPYAYNRNMAA